MNSLRIIRFDKSHILKVREFSDRWIGPGYFSEADLKKIVGLSQSRGLNASFVLLDSSGDVQGIRLTFAPGTSWLRELPPYLPKESPYMDPGLAYLKTLFLARPLRGLGWGPKLTQASLQALASMGATAVLTHAWKESPYNSAVRYVEKLGFRKLREIPDFWGGYDYLCEGCGRNPCSCTAVEMIYELPS